MTKQELDLAIPLQSSAFVEITKLTKFIIENYKYDIVEGESAVDMVIRMIAERKADGN